jgi:hypothetical protein
MMMILRRNTGAAIEWNKRAASESLHNLHGQAVPTIFYLNGKARCN